MVEKKLDTNFFAKESTIVAPQLLGKIIQSDEGVYQIFETAAFQGGTQNNRPKLENLAMQPGAIYPHYSCGIYTLAINTEAQGTPSVITITGIKGGNDVYTPKSIAKILGLGKGNLGEIVNVDSNFQIYNNPTDNNIIVEKFLPAKAPENMVSKYRMS